MKPQDSQIHFVIDVAGYATVDADRPHVSEELNPGAATTPRPAATVLLLRGGSETLEVLLVKRNPERGFMAGAWVFPGGSVETAEGSDDAAPRCDGQECVDLGWFTPRGALDAHARGEILLVFPTIKTLEQLGAFDTADALIEHARGRDVQPVEPRVLVSGEAARIVLPGEPGYE